MVGPTSMHATILTSYGPSPLVCSGKMRLSVFRPGSLNVRHAPKVLARSRARMTAASPVQSSMTDEQEAASRLRQNQLCGTPEGYRAQAVEHGIPPRPHGLFPEDDSLLEELLNSADLSPFEKHLPGEHSPYQHLPDGGWMTGDAAAMRGIDLRMFYRPASDPGTPGELDGTVRLGDGASIGRGFWVSAHGGAVESILDEATAELAKCEFTPTLATVEANFKIRKAVPLHTSLRIECKVVRMRGIRCWVDGRITSADRAITYAECSAQLVNITSWL